VVVVALYLICTCLHCLLGEEDEDSDHQEDKVDNDDTDLEEREADASNRTDMNEKLGPALEYAPMLSPSKRAAYEHDLAALKAAPGFPSFVKNLMELPPEVGDLVHLYCDEALPPYDLSFAKFAHNLNALKAVPLGIVTQASQPFEDEYDNECDRPADDPAINLVAVRRLQDGDLGRNSLLFEQIRAIPIGLVPKLCGDVIHDWPTPSGTRTIPTLGATEDDFRGSFRRLRNVHEIRRGQLVSHRQKRPWTKRSTQQQNS
jgi:hypothetical protein